MSRTYREIPASPYRDREERKWAWASEEKRHAGYTEKVRDKDNHHCLYSKPPEFKRIHKRRYRSNVNDELRKVEQMMWKNPMKHVSAFEPHISAVDLDVVLPEPKEFQPYWW